MKDLRDLSKLPTDAAYWQELEARVLGAVAVPPSRRPAVPLGWWTPLATRAGALSALATSAGIAALMLVPPRTRGEAPNTALLFRLPDDPAMNAFLTSPRPPSLGSLLIGYPRSAP